MKFYKITIREEVIFLESGKSLEKSEAIEKALESLVFDGQAVSSVEKVNALPENFVFSYGSRKIGEKIWCLEYEDGENYFHVLTKKAPEFKNDFRVESKQAGFHHIADFSKRAEMDEYIASELNCSADINVRFN